MRCAARHFGFPALVAFIALAVTLPARGAGISERLLACILTETPTALLVPAGQQWQRAEAAAAEVPGATTFWGVGRSMEPLFPDRTAIVVARIPFAELRKGMTILYVTRTGRMVAHPITAAVPKGWIAQGVNNRQADAELVTRANLVGVIVEAYAEIPSAERLALVNDLVAKRRLPPKSGT